MRPDHPPSREAATDDRSKPDAPLDVALREEIERLDLMICRLWRVLASLSIILGLFTYLSLNLRMGAWCALAAAVLLVWFSVEERIRLRGPAPEWLIAINMVIESTMPWAFLLIIAVTQSAAYALGSWVPPMLYCGLIVAATARLRPILPMLLAVCGAIAFPSIYFGVLRDMLPPSAINEPLLSPPMQITRSITLLGAGVLGAGVARGLQHALRRAHGRVREQDLFGKYRLERRLAAGGMGTVFLATYCPEGGFERPVAVKQIHEHLAQAPRFVDAFRHEAELSARLVHPNIVQVLDFGRNGDRYFLALEFVDGMTLGELLKELRHRDELMALALTAYVAREVLAGLAYSHDGARDAAGHIMRVVHRDLCPSNIMVSQNGEVKIADFGVARALKDAASASTTSVVGHVAYISPEQARAKPVDERSDLFSLGAIIWEMLCNRPLFNRGAEAPTLMALVHDDIPPPSKERGLLDPAWDNMVMSSLVREVEGRARSAKALLTMLDDISDAHPREDMAAHLGALVKRFRSPEDDDMVKTTRARLDDLATRVR